MTTCLVLVAGEQSGEGEGKAGRAVLDGNKSSLVGPAGAAIIFTLCVLLGSYRLKASLLMLYDGLTHLEQELVSNSPNETARPHSQRKDLHSHNGVVAGRRKHCRLGGMPRDRVDTATAARMCVHGLHQLARRPPDVHSRVCKAQSVSKDRSIARDPRRGTRLRCR